MKVISIFSAFFLISNYANAQYWITGDTVGRKQVFVEQTFEPNTSLIFDIDCDGEADLNIYSNNVISDYNGQFTVIRHNFRFNKVNEVEVLHDFGKIRIYEIGDSLPYADSLWTSLLDYIYLEDRMGSYGQRNIGNKFIAFRKNTIDTAYCFIRLSNFVNTFTIHEIISNCAVNPLDIIITIPEEPEELEKPEEDIITDSLTLIYPNPATFLFNQITIDGIDIKEVVFYDNFGRKLFKVPYTRQMYLPRLPKGLNFVKAIHENGEQEILKLIIQ